MWRQLSEVNLTGSIDDLIADVDRRISQIVLFRMLALLHSAIVSELEPASQASRWRSCRKLDNIRGGVGPKIAIVPPCMPAPGRIPALPSTIIAPPVTLKPIMSPAWPALMGNYALFHQQTSFISGVAVDDDRSAAHSLCGATIGCAHLMAGVALNVNQPAAHFATNPVAGAALDMDFAAAGVRCRGADRRGRGYESGPTACGRRSSERRKDYLRIRIVCHRRRRRL